MPPENSDSVSLGEIDGELKRVQANKEEHRRALEELEQEEVRLHGLAHGLREFLTRRSRATDSGVDAVMTLADGTVAVIQVKEHAPGIVDRAVAALRTQPRGETLDTWPLIERMKEAGYTSSAENIYLSVYGTLNRASKRPDGPLAKIGSKWGLREWYPEGVPQAPSTAVDVFALDDTEEEEQPMLISETVP